MPFYGDEYKWGDFVAFAELNSDDATIVYDMSNTSFNSYKTFASHWSFYILNGNVLLKSKHTANFYYIVNSEGVCANVNSYISDVGYAPHLKKYGT
jgi:hypothetical protein